MAKVIVAQGETLLSIAHKHGIFSSEKIWDHPENRSLREKRGHPQVLAPGDELFVPELAEIEIEISTNRSHVFRLKNPPCFFSVYLRDEWGEPYSGNRYQLKLGAEVFEGVTTDAGLVSHPTKPDVTSGELTLWRDPENESDTCTWTLRVGYLNPIDMVSGVKARLRNLGYQVGEIDDRFDETAREAVRTFQRSLGYEQPTGDIDDRTRNELVRLENDY